MLFNRLHSEFWINFIADFYFMENDNIIVNKVAQSPLITIDIKDFYPEKSEYEIYDIANYLYERLILKEKNFRQQLKEIDYSFYKNKYLGVYCSEDAIIPQWAYLLVVTHFQPFVKKIFFANEKKLIQNILIDKINALSLENFKDKPIVIKGCSDKEIEIEVYMELTSRLMPVAKSIMYGEPCSTVPLFKRK